jgi:hypothetical protein
MDKRLLDILRSRNFEKKIRADTQLINTEERRIPFILVSKNNAGERYDWWEGRVYIEELDPKGAVLTELRTFFKDHEPSVDNAIGRVENLRLEGGEIKCDVVFGSDEDSLKVFQKYAEGILTDVSIGYTIDEVVETEKKGEPTHVLVTKFTIMELSAVWKGFDSGATVGRNAQKRQESVDEEEGEDLEAAALESELRERKLKLFEKEIQI